MKIRVNPANPGLTGQEEVVSENGLGSPSSGDESKLAGEPSSKKSRKDVQRRVVTVPIGDVEGSKSKGETYSPSDSWAWRKYGQKPIKGSPYPRGYYRCSSSKGCPARKQVERSRVDPTTLLITYSCDHNHPVPTTKSHHATSSAPPPAPPAATSSSGDSAASPSTSAAVPLSFSALELGEDCMLANNSGIFGWIDDVSYGSVLESPVFDGSGGSDVAMVLSTREEDESLFADLEELPECSLVFRGRLVEPDETNRRCDCSFGPVTCCGRHRIEDRNRKPSFPQLY